MDSKLDGELVSFHETPTFICIDDTSLVDGDRTLQSISSEFSSSVNQGSRLFSEPHLIHSLEKLPARLPNEISADSGSVKAHFSEYFAEKDIRLADRFNRQTNCFRTSIKNVLFFQNQVFFAGAHNARLLEMSRLPSAEPNEFISPLPHPSKRQSVEINRNIPTLLVTSVASSAWAHFVLEDLPRIVAFIKSTDSTAVKIFTTDFNNITQNINQKKESIVTGLFPNKKIEFFFCKPTIAYLFEQIEYLTPTATHPGFHSSWGLSLLREQIEKVKSPHNLAPKNLLVLRRDERMLDPSSLIKLLEILKPYDFKVVFPEDLSGFDQAMLFSNAEKVIGILGGSMANTVFCNSSTAVMYLSNDCWENHLYWALENAAGRKFHIYYGTSIKSSRVGARYYGFSVNSDNLSKFLKSFIEKSFGARNSSSSMMIMNPELVAPVGSSQITGLEDSTRTLNQKANFIRETASLGVVHAYERNAQIHIGADTQDFIQFQQDFLTEARTNLKRAYHGSWRVDIVKLERINIHQNQLLVEHAGWARFLEFNRKTEGQHFNEERLASSLSLNREVIELEPVPTLFCTNEGYHNWGHFLVEDLPRIVAYIREQTVPEVRIIMTSATAVNKQINEKKSQLIRGLFPNRRILLDYLTPHQIYEIVQVDYVTPTAMHADFHSVEFFQLTKSQFAMHHFSPVQGNRKLLVLRKTERSLPIKTRSSLIFNLVQRGFELVYPEDLSGIEQAEIFAQASHIIGLAGAAMANIIFAPQSAQIMYLSPASWKTPFYWDLANIFNRDFYCYYGTPIEVPGINPDRYDYTVNVQNLLEFAKKIPGLEYF